MNQSIHPYKKKTHDDTYTRDHQINADDIINPKRSVGETSLFLAPPQCGFSFADLRV